MKQSDIDKLENLDVIQFPTNKVAIVVKDDKEVHLVFVGTDNHCNLHYYINNGSFTKGYQIFRAETTSNKALILRKNWRKGDMPSDSYWLTRITHIEHTMAQLEDILGYSFNLIK